MTDSSKPLPLRVLVVEDDDGLAAMLTQVLVKDGYFVTRARDGDEAMGAFTREMPHVCLVDCLLPKRSGFDVAKAMRATALDKVGVVLMSAAFRRGDKAAVGDTGADAFMSKPFVLHELRKRVKDLGERSHAKRAPSSLAGVPAGSLPRTRSSTALMLTPFAPGRFDASAGVARALLATSRAGASGVVRIESEASVLELAFLSGILVGARDNLRETRLGERLLAQGKITHAELKAVNLRLAAGERVAEALVALGLMSAVDALGLIEEQVTERVGRAISWRSGTIGFTPDEATAHRLAVESFDVQHAILKAALDDARAPHDGVFLFARGAERVERTVDFDGGLVAYAAIRPRSKLPAALLLGGGVGGSSGLAIKVDDLGDADARDLYALWLAGLIRLAGDAPADTRPVARPLAAAVTPFVDVDAAQDIAAALLKMRGRPAHDALGLPASSSTAELSARLIVVEGAVGIDRYGTAKLGPARAAAAELWSLLDDLRESIALREIDVTTTTTTPTTPTTSTTPTTPTTAPTPPPPTPTTSTTPTTPPTSTTTPTPPTPPTLTTPASSVADPEVVYLDGLAALSAGRISEARRCFDEAMTARPNDPDFNASFAWAALLDGQDEPFCLDILDLAARAYPEAMRPQLYLGLVAQRRGDVERARTHLRAAASRAPHDVEVQRALQALPPA